MAVPTSLIAAPVIAMLLTMLSGCGRHAPESLPPAASEATGNGTPEAQFERFLRASILRRTPDSGTARELSATFSAGWGDAAADNMETVRWLAEYRIISVVPDPDSAATKATGTALVTTVVEERPGSVFGGDGRYETTAALRIREDTAHWTLRRGAETGNAWNVIGGTREGYSLDRHFWSSTITRWEPVGASETSALAAADSIRRVRGLPILP